MQPELEQSDILVEGARFHYYRTTNTAGRPVLVLQHGFSDNGLCWLPVAQQLSGTFDILMPDARGHGQSERVAAGQSVDQAADLAAFLAALGVEQAVVGGHSMGAQIAFALGARFPALVRALLLEDPPWFAPDPAGQPAARFAAPESPMGQWLAGLRQQPLAQVIEECRAEHPTWPEPYLHAWAQGKQQLDPNFLTTDSRRTDWQEQVGSIRCPTLLVTANPERGGIVTPEIAAQVQRRNPNFTVANFPEAGHHVRFAAHEAYMQVVTDFLRPFA